MCALRLSLSLSLSTVSDVSAFQGRFNCRTTDEFSEKCTSDLCLNRKLRSTNHSLFRVFLAVRVRRSCLVHCASRCAFACGPWYVLHSMSASRLAILQLLSVLSRVARVAGFPDLVVCLLSPVLHASGGLLCVRSRVPVSAVSHGNATPLCIPPGTRTPANSAHSLPARTLLTYSLTLALPPSVLHPFFFSQIPPFFSLALLVSSSLLRHASCPAPVPNLRRATPPRTP